MTTPYLGGQRCKVCAAPPEALKQIADNLASENPKPHIEVARWLWVEFGVQASTDSVRRHSAHA